MVSQSLVELMDEKSVKKFGKSFSSLSEQQKSAIHYEIIESSARPAAKFNTLNKVLKITGKVLVVVTIAYAVYEVSGANNKTKAGIVQASNIAGGVAGTLVAGATFSVVCGPAAPVCTIAYMIVGGIAGSLIASGIISSLDDELEEFTQWKLQ